MHKHTYINFSTMRENLNTGFSSWSGRANGVRNSSIYLSGFKIGNKRTKINDQQTISRALSASSPRGLFYCFYLKVLNVFLES